MTPEEAINNIKDVLSSDLNYDESIDYQLTSDDIDWLEKAKEALEKQIPKKVKYLNRHGGGSDLYNKDYFNCPSCGRRLRNKQKDKYCPNCAQALDWSDGINDETKENSCSGCVYENVDDTTDAISNCVCCSRMSEFAKKDYYRKK